VNFEDTIKLVGRCVEALGVGVIVVGIVLVSLRNALRARRHPNAAYHNYRQGIGRTILLGLEILVAGDIIRTVAIDPTFTSVGVLAIIVVVRTFLSWSLEVELEGRWPWTQRQQDAAPPGADDSV
jgi:uncharacterized membrane protein